MTKLRAWWLWRWTKRIALGLLALLILLLAVGSIYEALGRRSAANRYPPRGQMVDIGGRRVHIDCRGTGAPTVILEAGLGTGGTIDWTLVHDRLAAFTRTCAYDRAGIMWSDPGNRPQHAATVAEDLHATLAAAGISGPLVLVGHSVGGPYVRTYAGRYGDQVAGLVMVDPSTPDQVARLGKATGANVDPARASTLFHVGSALAWTGLVRVMASAASDKHLPPDAAAAQAAYASKSISGAAAELDGFNRSMADARAVRSFGNRPLIVLTAMAPFTRAQLKELGMTPAAGARFKQEWRLLHAEQARFSTRGHQRIVPDATHYIQFDRPDVVVVAVRAVVDTVRGDGIAEQPTGDRQ